MNSWAARIISQVAGVRMGVDEYVGDFWRRIYRTGHEKLAMYGGSLDYRRRQRLHAFAGHLARDSQGLAGAALRTRPLSWWRYCQKSGMKLHKTRFHPWRWESQMEDTYGVAASLFVDESVGWVQLAQDRANCKLLEKTFATMQHA